MHFLAHTFILLSIKNIVGPIVSLVLFYQSAQCKMSGIWKEWRLPKPWMFGCGFTLILPLRHSAQHSSNTQKLLMLSLQPVTIFLWSNSCVPSPCYTDRARARARAHTRARALHAPYVSLVFSVRWLCYCLDGLYQQEVGDHNVLADQSEWRLNCSCLVL